MDKNIQISDLGDGMYVASAKSISARVEVVDDKETLIDTAYSTAKAKSISAKDKQWAAWGKDNKLPLKLTKLLYGNNLAPGSLDVKDQIAIGDKLVLYYEHFENNKRIPVPFEDVQVEDWLEEAGIPAYLEEAAIDYNWFANFFVELRTGRGSKQKQIWSIKSMEAMDCRSEVMDKNGRINHIGIGDWNSKKHSDIDVVPNYDPELKELQSKFMLHQKKKSPGSPYYPLPSYVGAQNWLRHANKIPLWKTNNMDNQANIKYHIQIPERYFQNLYPEPDYTKEERNQKRRDKVEEIITMLSGSDNPGKAFVSEFAIDKTTGKELPGWSITPIANETNHEAYSKDFEDSNSAILSSLAVDPSLSGVMLPGNMGAGSGSEKRLAYEFHAKIKTRIIRRLMLEPVLLAMKINKFDRRKIEGRERRVKLGIQDIQFTTLDENPTGKQNTMK